MSNENCKLVILITLVVLVLMSQQCFNSLAGFFSKIANKFLIVS